MKIFFVSVVTLLLVVCLTSFAMAASENEADGSEAAENESSSTSESDALGRHQVVSCDLLGFYGDSLCAARCIAVGRRGGYCDSRRVCNCRN
ncbi:phormicin [Musca domestica]|uniref:Phormicin n=1 Tax=Musca domestica TaxID=7370 RepID=A0A9J7IHJ3_MUSDO|nr:phormicin [Musca domestica]